MYYSNFLLPGLAQCSSPVTRIEGRSFETRMYCHDFLICLYTFEKEWNHLEILPDSLFYSPKFNCIDSSFAITLTFILSVYISTYSSSGCFGISLTYYNSLLTVLLTSWLSLHPLNLSCRKSLEKHHFDHNAILLLVNLQQLLTAYNNNFKHPSAYCLRLWESGLLYHMSVSFSSTLPSQIPKHMKVVSGIAPYMSAM